MQRQVNKKTVVAATVFLILMENRILPYSLITQGLFWGQEVASLTTIILLKGLFSTKANYLPLEHSLSKLAK